MSRRLPEAGYAAKLSVHFELGIDMRHVIFKCSPLMFCLIIVGAAANLLLTQSFGYSAGRQ